MLRSFLRERQDGAATVDWVIICAGATSAAMIALNLGQDGLTRYSSDVRNEVQAPYFDTSWTQNLTIPPPETWAQSAPITPVVENIVSGDTSNDDDNPEEIETDPVDAANTAGGSDPGQGGAPGGSGGNVGATNGGGGSMLPAKPDPVSVINGNFANNASEGWTFSGSGMLLVYANSLGFNASNTAPGGVASQTVTVQSGFSYQLSLDAYEHGAPAANHTLVIEVVDANGVVLASQTVLVKDSTRQTLTVPFTATTNQVTLRFSNPTSTATVATDLKIDNIVVS